MGEGGIISGTRYAQKSIKKLRQCNQCRVLWKEKKVTSTVVTN